MSPFSCSTNLWRLFTKYEPLKVSHGYTTKRPFSGFAGFPIDLRPMGGGQIGNFRGPKSRNGHFDLFSDPLTHKIAPYTTNDVHLGAHILLKVSIN